MFQDPLPPVDPHKLRRAAGAAQGLRGFTLAVSKGPISNTTLENRDYPSFEAFAASLETPGKTEVKEACAYFIRGKCNGSKERNDGNIADAQVVLLDADKRIVDGKTREGAPPAEKAITALNRLGYNYVLWTTWRHMSEPDFHRYRIAVEASRGLSREEVPQAADFLLGKLREEGVDIAPAKEANVWAQAWFFPAVHPDREAAYTHVARCNGRPLDIDTIAKAPAIEVPAIEVPRDWLQGGLTDIEALTEAILKGSDFHNATRDLAACYAAQGMTFRGILETLQGIMKQSAEKGTARWKERYEDLRNLTASALEKFGKEAKLIAAAKAGEGKSPEEVRQVVEEVLQPAKRIPVPLEDYPPVLRDFYREVSRWAKVDPAMVCGHGLGIIAAAVKAQIVVEELPGLSHHLTQLVVTAAASGERKSPAHAKLLDPLDDMEAELQEQWEEELRKWQGKEEARKRDMRALDQDYRRAGTTEEQRVEIKQELKKLAEDAEPAPAKPVFYVDDATPEQYVRKLQAAGGALSILSPEGRGFAQTLLGHYSDSQSREAVFLQAYSGDTIKYDRVTGGSDGKHTDITVRKPAGTIAVMVQDDIVDKILEHRDVNNSGFIARVSFVRPTPRAGTRFETEDDRPIAEPAQAAYNKLIRNLCSHKAAGRGPIKVRLDEDAALYRRELFNSIERRMRDGEDLAHYRAVASKATTKVVKTAGLLRVIDACKDRPLHGIDVGAAGRVLEVDGETWLQAQSISAWMMQETLATSEEHDPEEQDAAAGAVLEWLRRQPQAEVSRRDIQRLGPSCARKSGEKMDDLIAALLEAGAIKARKCGERVKYRLA